MKKHKRLKLGVVAVLLLCCACWGYTADYYHADDIAVAAMSSAADVTVEQKGNTLAFVPEDAETGLIFYPGGKVEYTAYAPLMRALADNGVLAVLVKMPLNLAVLHMNAANDIPEQYPQIRDWYIGGHSLGGSMAASHAAKNALAYDGLVLLASYSTADLSASGLRVISIFGSKDGVLNMEKYAEYRRNLPAALEEHIIEGGCHAGFGSYGPQDGDGVPTITGEAQIAEAVRLLMAFLDSTRE
ncbi:MAG: alpha/beta hydrolase [Clostridiales bacterium]|nr:alpha/beta hydrolase [Clostridiales bacterium]